MQIKLGDSLAQGTENAVSVLGTDLEQLIRERYEWLKWFNIICSQLIPLIAAYMIFMIYSETHIHFANFQTCNMVFVQVKSLAFS
jgi:uncharacterized paraquat-inducible protein A